MAKVVIVGGGVAGIAAGIYCLMDGHCVTICEQHNTAGGNLTGWQRGEYHIDNCIHWLTGTNPATDTYKMWCELGALGDGIEIIKNETLYTCEIYGKRVSLWRDVDKTERNMLDVAPEDKGEIRDFIRAVKTVMGLCGTSGKECDKGFSAIEKMIRTPQLLKYYALTTGELAARFKSVRMQYFISAMMGDDFGALALIMVFATFCGANGDLPQGGSLAMAKRMAERFVSLGGELMLGSAVRSVNVEGGRASSVTLDNGKELDADYVILSTDPAAAFGKLIDAPMPRWLKKQYDSPRLERFSSYHCAFSCDAEKPPFDADIMFPIPKKYRRLLRTDSLTLREFSHEESFAPKGKTVIQSMTFLREADARAFIDQRKENREGYKIKKQRIASAIEQLTVAQFPSLEGKLHLIDVWTPATYRRFTHAEMGSYMSFAMPSLYLPRRKSNRIKGLENVLLATQWQQLPGGLPTAAGAGKAAAETVSKLSRRAEKTPTSTASQDSLISRA